jgi:hypothetical protein
MVVTAIVLSCLTSLVDMRIARSYHVKARQVHHGDSKGRVLNVIGKPTCVFLPRTMLFNQMNRETWIYGRQFTLKHAISAEPPFFWPIRLRFGPFEDDVIVEFDESGKVIRIYIPT